MHLQLLCFVLVKEEKKEEKGTKGRTGWMLFVPCHSRVGCGGKGGYSAEAVTQRGGAEEPWDQLTLCPSPSAIVFDIFKAEVCYSRGVYSSRAADRKSYDNIKKAP